MTLSNNFNLLRLVFALFVIISHCYPLSGAHGGDYLSRLTQEQITFSFIGLSGFFIISGYLVFQSLERSKTLFDYFKKRCLRIFPGLFVMLFLTVLLGFFVYESDFRSYITNSSVWTYLPRNLFLIHEQGIIDGIFTANPYNPTINGSLWSILYEFSFYIFLAALFFFERRAQIIITVLTLLILLTARLFWYAEVSKYNYILESGLVLQFGPFFAFGALLALLRIEKIKNQLWIVAFLILALGLFTYLELFDVTKYFLLPIIVVLMGLSSWSAANQTLSKTGDISYGVYIYAFPVQQTLVHFFKLNALELMLPSVFISCILGYCSWHLVERYALSFK